MMTYVPKPGDLVLITHRQGWRVDKDLLGICLRSSSEGDDIMTDVLVEDASVSRVPKFRIIPVQ
jgi:hypothetical protein